MLLYATSSGFDPVFPVSALKKRTKKPTMLLFIFPPTECSSRTHSKRKGVERQTFVGAPLTEEREACLRERTRNHKLIWNTNKATLEKKPQMQLALF